MSVIDSLIFQRDELMRGLVKAKQDLAAAQEALQEREEAMHIRIRAEYDKTVADAWKAELAKEQEARQRAEAIAEQCRTDTEIAEKHQAAAEALAESYQAAIGRAHRVMGGEGVEDQAQAWDQCLRILDAAIDAIRENS